MQMYKAAIETIATARDHLVNGLITPEEFEEKVTQALLKIDEITRLVNYKR